MTAEPPAQADASASDVRARPRSSRKRGWMYFLRDVLVIIVIAVLVSFLIKTFVVRSFYIPSKSMESTLLIGDRILVDELTPGFGGYSRGDVVVFTDPGGWLPATIEQPRSPIVEAFDGFLGLVGLSASDSDDHLIKRIIGMPGDRVVCCNPIGQLTVNGVPIDDTPFIQLGPGSTASSALAFDVTVPDDALWVLGDNRDSSKDSRYNQEGPGKGFVPLENVVGRAFLITWPLDRFGLIDFHHDVFAGVPEATPTR